MGYSDSEYPSPVELFTHMEEPAPDDERLRRRMCRGQGRAIHRLAQLDRFYIELRQEPSLKMEYDRFLSIRRRTPRQ